MAKGDHIWVQRRGYTHHGVDAGDGTVIHYTGTPWKRTGPIERWTLEKFAKGAPVNFVGGDDPDVALERAESRIGEDSYNLATNNCEHFARWCVEGDPRSPQVATVGVCTTLLAVGVFCWFYARRD